MIDEVCVEDGVVLSVLRDDAVLHVYCVCACMHINHHTHNPGHIPTPPTTPYIQQPISTPLSPYKILRILIHIYIYRERDIIPTQIHTI